MNLHVWMMAVLLVACHRPSQPSQRPGESTGVYTLRYATPYPPRHPFSRADQRWIDHLQRASQGALRVDAFWSGTLTSADQSVIELRHGVADVAAIQPIYQRGGAHALRTQTGFYAGARGFDEQVTVYKCLARRYPIFDQELSGLTVLAVQGGSLPGIVSRNTPVRRLEDVRGLRLRAPAELMELLRSLGADPVNMPMGDVYAALARGVIDAVVAPLDAMRPLHLAEVAHYYATLAIPRGAYPARAIRTQRLRQLPPALQTLLHESGTVWEQALSQELSRARRSGATYAASHGIQLSHVPAADQNAFDRAYNAAAQARARELTRDGLDATAILDTAQQLITRLRSQPLPPSNLCPDG